MQRFDIQAIFSAIVIGARAFKIETVFICGKITPCLERGDIDEWFVGRVLHNFTRVEDIATIAMVSIMRKSGLCAFIEVVGCQIGQRRYFIPFV